MTTDNFCFYLQNRLIQTSQTGGQWYSDTSLSMCAIMLSVAFVSFNVMLNVVMTSVVMPSVVAPLLPASTTKI
jgi:hypothetical protein